MPDNDFEGDASLTFQYYEFSYNSLPLMSPILLTLFVNIAASLGKVHIVHLGSVGDNRHKLDNPDSLHLIKPLPRAIDVQKVYINDELLFDCRDRLGKFAFRTVVLRHGGRTHHESQDWIQHLHVEVGKDEGQGLMPGESW